MDFDPAVFRRNVRRILDAYAGVFGKSDDDHVLLRSQIDRGHDLHDRRTFPGHITTSAIILDHEARQTLLIRHRSLSRWLQPGGHYEPPGNLAASALREAVEETGLQNLMLDPWYDISGLPIDIDTHRIPARPERNEPEHWHHDVRYLVRADRRTALKPSPSETDGAQWHELAILEEITPQALRNLRRLAASERAGTALS